MNKQQLASKIWESANKMRSKIEASEYKDYILGFIFYKFLSDKELKFLIDSEYSKTEIVNLSESDTDSVQYLKDEIGYFISYENLFSTWIEKGNDFDVSDVRDSLSAFSRLISPAHKKVFGGIFDTLQTGLSKLGDSASSQTKVIRNLIYLIKDIPMDGKQDYDVLGFIYEYLISQFAANAGKKAGEFYTPHEVSVLMSEIVAYHLKGTEKIKIFDPTSGSGSLLINIGNSIAKNIQNDNEIMYYAQELKVNTYNLTRMNLVMRGINPSNIKTRNGDTLERDWPMFDENDPIGTYDPLFVDAVVSNPPYSQVWDPENKEVDPRFAEYGLAPRSKADYAFLLNDLYHINNSGIMTIVLPHGVLFRGGEEGNIRKNLIEKNNIDAIIGLPANIFFGTGIPTIIMVLKKQKKNTDVLIIDASKGFIKEGKTNKLRACDIKKIKDVYALRADVENYSKSVTRDEIRKNEYNLNIPRYVDSSDKSESWDLYASMFGGIPELELHGLDEFWNTFSNLKSCLFKDKIPGYYDICTKEIKNTIINDEEVKAFLENYSKSFDDFSDFLETELFKLNQINLAQEPELIGAQLFKTLSSYPLIDKYEAYQIFEDQWSKIVIDLEIIKSEGIESIKKVDPNMVSKKKKGKDVEIQEGWVGRIIPFELAQKELLKELSQKIEYKENRLSEISSEYQEIMDSLEEDQKDVLNDSNDSFVLKNIVQVLKTLQSDNETKEFRNNLKKVKSMMAEEKELKSQLKKNYEAIHLETKKAIENLSDEESLQLLKLKWINPIVQNLIKLSDELINRVSNEIQSIEDKYSTTLSDIESEIKDTENSLCSLIDELTGSESDMEGLHEFKRLLMGK